MVDPQRQQGVPQLNPMPNPYGLPDALRKQAMAAFRAANLGQDEREVSFTVENGKPTDLTRANMVDRSPVAIKREQPSGRMITESIWHTHPNRAPEPSAHDKEIAARSELPIYVISRRYEGISATAYDPKTKKLKVIPLE